MSEKFSPRGIGMNWLPCFVCGKGGKYQCQNDMASFVDGRAGGLRVQAMFAEAGLDGFLDYRPSEPNWVQYKLGTCEEHLPALRRLEVLAAENGHMISPELIAEALSACGKEAP